MVGSPSNIVGLTHLQPLIAACIGDIVPPFSHTVLLCCWFQNQNIFSAFRSAPTYGDFGQQNQHLSVKTSEPKNSCMVYKSSSQKIKLRRLKLIGILEQMRKSHRRGITLQLFVVTSS